jgi:hypothetical protein
MSELTQVETHLNPLEDKLRDFHQALPRPDRRRGLINFRGTVLRTVFGTATVSHVHILRDVLSEVQLQNLSNQLTYVKKLDSYETYTEAIANLSNILKHNMIQANDKFQQIASDIL